MKMLLWVAVGWLGVTLWTALGSRLVFGHVIPDCAVITVVFLALRRDPMPLLLSALLLGYLVGRQSAAPLGLHEASLGLCAIGVYLVAGHLAATGSRFFAVTVAVTAMAHHLLLFLLIYWVHGSAGFSSWASAVLLPAAVVTSVVGWASYPAMDRLDRRLTAEKREGLSWR